MKTKLFLKILGIIFIAAVIFSAAPLIDLYIQKAPTPYFNEQAISKLNRNDGALFEFIVTSDIHSGLPFDDSATLKLIRNMNREGRFKKAPVDFVSVIGDLTFRGSPWDYSMFNKVRSHVNRPVICAKGNHDDDVYKERLFKKYVGEAEFAFTDRNSYFIVIDNSIGDLTDKQFSFLEEELKKSVPYTHRFIFMHKPPISPYQQAWYRPELSSWSYKFMKLCEKYNVDIVFSGHEHMFKERLAGGVKYIVTGGGGMISNIPTPDGGFLHYIVVRVYGDYVDYEVRRIFPPLWEYFTYYLWKDIFYFTKRVFL